MIEYCFLPFLSNLVILTVAIELFVGRWSVGEEAYVLSLNGAKLRFLCYK
jgi:hypothetical protein